MGLSDQIADFVVDTSYDRIPSDAIRVAKDCVLDALGVALAGSQEPASRASAEYVRSCGGKAEASLIGHELKSTPALAALANGVAAHALDFDDTTWAYVGHASAVILPAALALGERVRAPGKELLCSFVAGVEVACRVGALVTPRAGELGWHPTSAVGVLGAAAAGASILGLSRDQTVNATGIAASQASGLKANFGTMTKPFHAGKAAHDGVVAATLAKLGLDSAHDALDHRYGLLTALGGDAGAREARVGWGSPFAIVRPGVVFKQYPSCTGTHPAVDAAIALAREHDIRPDRVESISVGTTPDVPGELLYVIPRSGLEGKFSMHFCVAVALSERDLAGAHFTDDYVNKPIIGELMSRCNTYVEPALTREAGDFSPAGVLDIRLKDGTTLSRRVDLAKGNPENPLSLEELGRKFRECAGTSLSAGKVDRLLDTVEHLESVEDVATLLAQTH